MQKTAYAYLNLTPHDFWSLTLAQFNLMVESFEIKDDYEWRKLSQLASWVIQPHVKKEIKASDLYDKDKTNGRKKVSKEKKQEEMKELAGVMKVKY